MIHDFSITIKNKDVFYNSNGTTDLKTIHCHIGPRTGPPIAAARQAIGIATASLSEASERCESDGTSEDLFLPTDE